MLNTESQSLEVLNMLSSCQGSLRNTACYVLFPGEKWDKVKEKLIKQLSIGGTQVISRALQTEHTMTLALRTIAWYSGKS